MCYEKNAFNVLNTELKPCSTEPLTGFYRDGHCKTFNNDVGEHIICSEMTTGFLNFTLSALIKKATFPPDFPLLNKRSPAA